MQEILKSLANEEFCYLTTKGRTTGGPHEIEIWFALVPERRVVFMLSGARGRSDWVKNLAKEPEVSVRISGSTLRGCARVVEDEDDDPLARRLLVEKYEREPGGLATWRRDSLPVLVEISADPKDDLHRR